MPFPRPASPGALIADLRAFLAQRPPHQLAAAALAVLMPAIIITLFALDAKSAGEPQEQVVYVKLWAANRTDADIIADQKKAQATKEALAAERRRQFRKLEHDLGME